MRLRYRATVIAFLVTFLVAFTPAGSAAQGIRLGGDDVSATLRGILGGTLFAQDALFATGNGQRAQFVAGELDEWWHG
ncbi:MAG TPA: hypothetical protein VM778_14990, partial [Gemmatimonadota bacterium]|nr:hypothetical protein [Gemmatimonadota bacterium]